VLARFWFATIVFLLQIVGAKDDGAAKTHNSIIETPKLNRKKLYGAGAKDKPISCQAGLSISSLQARQQRVRV
jgi:hypothetical protein